MSQYHYSALANGSPFWQWRPSSRVRRLALYGFSFFILTTVFLVILLNQPVKVQLPARRPPATELPNKFRVVGLVFYGRRDRVSVLDCYLKENLVENGGRLDEVIFVAKTANSDDLDYLDELIQSSPSYSRYNLVNGPGEKMEFGSLWDIPQRGIMYLKIDDDVIYIGKDTVDRLVKTRQQHPEYLAVSANTINNPALSWVHYHLGAVRPYLPELSPPEGFDHQRKDAWRASKLPTWSGPEAFSMSAWYRPPFRGHRWLPLGNGYNTDGTPIQMATYNAFGPGWKTWTVAAQEHYSLLENLESNQLDLYKFKVWDYEYERLSINMIAIWGDDVVSNLPFPNDDERYLTMDLPKRLGRHTVVDGNAVASHYGFRPQQRRGKGLDWTDILDRYRAYAEEKVCRR